MPTEIILQRTPDDLDLLDKREQLAAVRATLAKIAEEALDVSTAIAERWFRRVERSERYSVDIFA